MLQITMNFDIRQYKHVLIFREDSLSSSDISTQLILDSIPMGPNSYCLTDEEQQKLLEYLQKHTNSPK